MNLADMRYHYVFSDGESPWINLHSHEFEKIPDSPHPDFQVVMPISPETGVYVLGSVVQWALNRTEQIETGVSYEDILEPNQAGQSVPLQFVEAEETGRRVLRVILPDPQMRFGQLAEAPYSEQAEAVV